MLLPKEHGAYGQIAFPLIAATGAGGLSIPGVLVTLAVLAGFLAHEPAAIALGLRGARVRRDQGASAVRWLMCWGATGIAAAMGAWIVTAPGLRWSFAVPGVPALLLAIAMTTGREKSWYGETLAALAFSGVPVPVMLAAGASTDAAWAVAIPFALLFITTTLAVRVVILRVRGGGNPGAAAATRRATLAISGAGAIGVGALILAGHIASSALIAAAPGLLAAAFIVLRPPPAAHLRRVGWTLVAVSTATTLVLIAAS